MNISGIIKDDICNGPGFRLSVFCSGCSHHCKGCHNSEYWSYDIGIPYNDMKEEILEELSKTTYDGISLLGGEPFDEPNVDGMCDLVESIRERFGSTRDIWIWSGSTYKELKKRARKFESVKQLLKLCDYLVDGPFVMEQRDTTLRFRGSRNQNIINLKNGKIERD